MIKKYSLSLILCILVTSYSCIHTEKDTTSKDTKMGKTVPDLMTTIQDSLESNGFQTQIYNTDDEIMSFSTYYLDGLDFNEKERFEIPCGQFSRKIFARSITPKQGNYYPRFYIQEIRTKDSETADWLLNVINHCMRHPDIWNDKVYDKAILSGRNIFYLYTGVKAFEESVEQWEHKIKEIDSLIVH